MKSLKGHKLQNLQGKNAIVTGGSKGIGRSVCLALANAGVNINVLDLNKDQGLNTVKEIIKLDVKAEFYEIDVAQESEWINFVTYLDTKNKSIDILVNNAGNNIPEHFTKVKTKNMEYLVKINTIATFNLAQLCALKMIKSKNRKKVGGAIVNMSSQMGHVGGPIRSVYNMNKWGLEGLTKGMSLDLAKYNIRVNTVCPTFVVTPMTKKFLKNKKFKKETLNNIPLGRFAELSEISSAVVFLASDAASMITGTSLLVDGGWTAK